MEEDGLPPGVSRGPWKGSRSPSGSPILWIAPAGILVVITIQLVSRWVRYGDGWTLLYLGMWLTGVVYLVVSVREFRRQRQSLQTERP